ncbi:phosphoribosyltransferase family protein [Micromonospora sp. NBC_00421]|uniref:phosphoribosyltransferase family protein n=1 Tax=Micromonospora sp. NBC_00421 TaxID=2975976 RepID=UPI002E214998
MSDVWTGRWVAERLGARITTESTAIPLALTDLVGLALRHNTRRVHLLVSAVLGKYVPADPALVYGVGRLLGAVTVDRVTGRDTGIARAGATLLRAALAGSSGSADALIQLCATHGEAHRVARPDLASSTTVLGYAETATALGHAVSDAWGADYLHSTRRSPPAARRFAEFEEEHSHATRHLLLPDDEELLSRGGPLVLVDDELSTGQTVLNTVAALHRRTPRSRYVIATLVDLREPADRARMASVARRMGVDLTVVALARGRLRLPTDVLSTGRRLVTDHEPSAAPTGAPAGGTPPRRLPLLGWHGAREGARHGFDRHDRTALHTAAERVAAQLVARFTGDRVLVLGSEELMYAPLLIANQLRMLLAGVAVVRFLATARSPALAVDDPGYAIRSRITFPSHDDPADGPGLRYAYNLPPDPKPGHGFTDVLVVVDSVGDTPALHAPGGLLDQLGGVCDQVHLLTLPSLPPAPETVSCPSVPPPVLFPPHRCAAPASARTTAARSAGC